MTTQEYNDIFKNPVLKQIEITSSGGVTISNTNIVSESMSLEQSLCSEENLRYGRCEASCFRIRIADLNHDFTGEWLDVTMKVVTSTEGWLLLQDGSFLLTEDGDRLKLSDEDIEELEVNLGHFKVYSDKPSNDRRWRDLVCYDRMYDILNADVTSWYNGLTFPMTIQAFRNSLFTHLSITQESASLVNDSFNVQGGFEADEAISAKTIIEAICEFNGVFGHVNADDKFQYMSPGTTQLELDYYKDGTGAYEDYVTEAVTGVKAIGSDDDVGTSVGTTSNVYIIENNPIIYGTEGTQELTTALTNILNLISAYTYRPFAVETYGNPMLPLGQTLKVSTKNQNIISYVINKTMTGIQALKDNYSALGQKKYPSKVNSISTQVKRTKGKVHTIKNTVDELSSEITAVSKLSIPILPVTRWIYNTYDDGRVQYQIVDEPELKYVDLTSGSFKFAIKGISLTDYYNAKKKEIYIKKGSTEIQALLWNLDSTVVTTEVIADELITIEYGVRGSISQGRFFVLPDSYASAQNIKTNTLIQQTADAINLKVSETVHATVPTSNYTDYATDVSTDTITFKFIDLPIFELIDITNSIFRFGMNVPNNFNDTQKARKKAIRIESTSSGTSQVITAPIFNENGTQVTDEIFSGKVVYLERATRTIGSSSVSGFWLYSDSYTQSQINMTKDQIVLKVDSSGNMYKTALGDAASSGSSFKIGANNISFITNGTIEMTSNDIAIDSTNFKVDSSGNVESKNFIVKTSTGTSGAFRIIDEDDAILGRWGTDETITINTYSQSSPSQTVSYKLRYCDFLCKNLYESSSLGDFDEEMSFGQYGLKVKLLVDPFASSASDRTSSLWILGYNSLSKKYIDIVNYTGWGLGSNSLIDSLAKISNVVKEKHFAINCSDMTSGMSLSSYVSLDSGYKFLCWLPTGASDGWVSSFPIYVNLPYSQNTNVYWSGTMPTTSGNKVLFTYLEIRDV